MILEFLLSVYECTQRGLMYFVLKLLSLPNIVIDDYYWLLAINLLIKYFVTQKPYSITLNQIRKLCASLNLNDSFPAA